MSTVSMYLRFAAVLLLGLYALLFIFMPSDLTLAGQMLVAVLIVAVMYMGFIHPLIVGGLLVVLAGGVLLRPIINGYPGELSFWLMLVAMPLIAGLMLLAARIPRPHILHH